LLAGVIPFDERDDHPVMLDGTFYN
jgi:hypothetical protein